MRLLGTIQAVPILETSDGRVVFISGMQVECDGSGGNPDHDRYFQPDTTLQHKGKALNPYTDRFIAVPPVIIKRTVGVVMGCQVYATNLLTNQRTPAVAGDIGPAFKIGEGSVACARAIGVPDNPNYGGTPDHIIGYEILPGVPAVVGDITYQLQPYRP